MEVFALAWWYAKKSNAETIGNLIPKTSLEFAPRLGHLSSLCRQHREPPPFLRGEVISTSLLSVPVLPELNVFSRVLIKQAHSGSILAILLKDFCERDYSEVSD